LGKPKITVIIASYNSRKTIEYCLNSLEEQASSISFEIIVVESSNDGIDEFINNNFPQVKVCNLSERKFPGDARNIGISKAKEEIIAFIDADCRAEKNWIEEISMAHDSSYPAIGGVIANANPGSYVGWAAYFCEFSRWMPGTPPGWMGDIAGANMSYKRAVFDRYGSYIEGTYCSDTDFHWRLRKDGNQLRFVPSILVYHNNIDKFGKFFKHEFSHGQFFAQVRVRGKNFSRLRRLIYIIFSPLITLKLFLKVVFINSMNRVYFTQFLKSLPFLVLGLISWSLGEAVGYLRK